MATSFPTALDQYATVPQNQAEAVKHRDRHQNVEDAVEALEAKVGVDNSAVPTSFDYRIRTLEGNPNLPGLDSSRVVYDPPFANSVERTAESRFSDMVSAKDFGAVGDGVTDDSAAIQAALDYVHSIGGGEVFLPPGRYRKDDTSPTLVVYENTTLRGAGDSSVIFHDDTATNPRMDLFICANAQNVTFRDFRISGTALTVPNQTNQSQALTGNNITNLRIENVTIERVRFMAAAFSYCEGVVVNCCRLDQIVRDGWRFTNSNNVTITGNTAKRVSDDVVALHSLDAAAAPGSGWVVSGNTFKHCDTPVIGNTTTWHFEPNYVWCDPAASGNNASNKGVRVLSIERNYVFIVYDADPASATYGDITTIPLSVSPSIPTTGKYVQGARVPCSAPGVAGAGGSQYTVIGWWRVTTGSSHVLNTDWREMRTLTGT